MKLFEEGAEDDDPHDHVPGEHVYPRITKTPSADLDELLDVHVEMLLIEQLGPNPMRMAPVG